MAIKACTQEQGHLLRNRDQMQMVKESLDEGYCDISGRVGDLDLVGEMGSVNIFVSRGRTGRLSQLHQCNAYASTDAPQLQSIMTTKHDIIARFIHVITPLGQIYKLPLTSLHIFYDQGGDLIAFNRNASIFLNLRYYEAWRKSPLTHCPGSSTNSFLSVDDADVLSGNLSSAYISWYVWLTANPSCPSQVDPDLVILSGSSLSHTRSRIIWSSRIIRNMSSTSLRSVKRISFHLEGSWGDPSCVVIALAAGWIYQSGYYVSKSIIVTVNLLITDRVRCLRRSID
jgi:hypothetical protein